MTELHTQLVTVFLAFFAVMNPIANTAAFAGLAGGEDRSEQFRIAAKALTITFFVVLVFALLGKTIFHLFGITLPALRITGGIVVFLVGYHMLEGKASRLHSADRKGDSDVATSPLAVPLLAGPGTIATAMNYSASGDLTGIAVTVSMFAVLCLLTFVCFMFSSKIMTAIGSSGLAVVTRLMGLILAVVGTQMVITGVTGIAGLHLTE